MTVSPPARSGLPTSRPGGGLRDAGSPCRGVVGDECVYACAFGWRGSGSRSDVTGRVRCVNRTSWSPPSPERCRRTICTATLYGYLRCEAPAGLNCSFDCGSSHRSVSATCLDDGQWTPAAPYCEPLPGGVPSPTAPPSGEPEPVPQPVVSPQPALEDTSDVITGPPVEVAVELVAVSAVFFLSCRLIVAVACLVLCRCCSAVVLCFILMGSRCVPTVNDRRQVVLNDTALEAAATTISVRETRCASPF